MILPDFSTPSAARMYDYWLGGKDHFQADREAAERVLVSCPEARQLALANRRFLTRAVWHLADHGVRQYIDLGSGLPTSPNVHEVARQVRPDAHVVYVDNDPVAVAHGRALCDADEDITFIEADIRDPQSVLHGPQVASLIDFSVPVAVLAVSVLHFLPDEDRPQQVLEAFRTRMAAGSYLVISHATNHGADKQALAEIADVYKASATPAVPRTPAAIKALFAGFDLIDPGLVDMSQWRTDMPEASDGVRFLAGAGRLAAAVPRAAREAVSLSRSASDQRTDSKEKGVSDTPAVTADTGREGELRAAMVRAMEEEGAIQTETIAAAFRAVPRHVFAPGERLEAAYAPHGTVAPKRDSDGLLLSVISAPDIQARMLEPAGIEPGMRVLEIGSGGYNAALIACLVGDGQVTTMDIDPDVTARARAGLDAAGYERVKVVTGDAEHGVPEGAPYDRIIVTAGSWDIPPAWISQLAPTGRLLVPLRFRGLTRTVTFEHDGEGLASRHYQLSAFVPFQGAGAHADRRVIIKPGIVLHTDDPDLELDASALNAALDTPRLEQWTGEKYDFPDEVSQYVATVAPSTAQLRASREAVDAGLIGRSALTGVSAMITGDSIAYRTSRKNPDNPTAYESGVIAHGPQAETLAEQYAALLRRWARNYCRRGTAQFRYLPRGMTPDDLPEGALAIVKRHGVLTITYP